MCEGTGQATRLRKRGKKKREDSRGTCEGTGQATRLRKRAKKKREKIRGGRVRVLGRLLGYGRVAKRRFTGNA